IQTNGDLTPLPQPSTATGNNPAALAAHPSGKFLYAANGGSNNITAYAIAADGDLSALGSAVATGSSPIAMALDPAGNFLLAANKIAIFSVNGDGSLSFLRSVRSRSGPASLVATQGARPRHLPMFAEVVSDDSLNGGLRSYSVDLVTGGLFAPHTATTGAQGS